MTRIAGSFASMMKAAPWPVTILFAMSLALNLWLAGVPDWRWIPAALAGWYVADLLSGLTHMYMDYRPCTAGHRARPAVPLRGLARER